VVSDEFLAIIAPTQASPCAAKASAERPYPETEAYQVINNQKTSIIPGTSQKTRSELGAFYGSSVWPNAPPGLDQPAAE
jgi:hypothetical protein